MTHSKYTSQALQHLSMIHVHNTAPAACRTCGHFERREIHGGDTIEHDDGCLKHKPMHEPCAWHTDGALMRIKSNRVIG